MCILTVEGCIHVQLLTTLDYFPLSIPFGYSQFLHFHRVLEEKL